MRLIQTGRKPGWLKIKIPAGKEYLSVREIVERNRLNTICSSGHCPNVADCWGRRTATFMILGDICTRSCKFCGVKTGRPAKPDPDEPRRIAESVRDMSLKHAVLTSVDRDDLPDGGSGHWAQTITAVKSMNPGTTLEVLIPDFSNDHSALQRVADVRPEIISHNIETVRRLTSGVRSVARYDRSLKVLEYLAKTGIRVKSGIMLGLGETREEILETLADLHKAGCEVVTIGQYLQPTRKQLPVVEYLSPGYFKDLEIAAHEMGFRHVESGPLVRSSFHAEKHVI
ncbi:MAG: lipoyl synthase [Bacteroidota bacterium]|nr:lipoyl synthase [Bacteroidota bacterium]